MRNITKLSGAAFMNDTYFSMSNTQVMVNDKETALYLHGHKIAYKDRTNQEIYFSLCGYPTLTTKERLKGIFVNVNIKQDEPYFNNSIKLDDNKVYKVSDLKKIISECA